MDKPLKNTSNNIRMLICGPSASGKTTVLKDAMHKHFRGIFNDIFVICPSLKQPLWQGIKFTGKREKDNKSDEPTDEQFNKFIKKIEENFKAGKRSLLILDDCINTDLLKRTSELCKMWLRIRHLDCSVVIISQNLKGVPPFIRTNLTHFCTFHNSNSDEVKKMTEEFGHKFLQNYEQYTSEPYKYVFCDFNKNELSDERYSNEIHFDPDFYSNK